MRTNREREGNFKGRREVEPSPVDPRDLQYMQWSGKARQPIDCARADVLTFDEWIQREACRKLPCGFLFCTGLFLNRETPCVPATVKLTIAVPWLMLGLALKHQQLDFRVEPGWWTCSEATGPAPSRV